MEGSEFQRALKACVRGEVHVDRAKLGCYSTDASIYRIEPRAVFVPLDAEDVVAAVAVAAEHGVSILPRGGGTSLAGQTVGDSLVIDFSKNLNRILEVNAEERWVRVQPGVVRDNLNSHLLPHDLHFAPDPATSSRANCGGMIGNNSAGVRSIVYGKTVDHVLESTVLLADGSRLDFKSLSRDEYAAKARQQDREGEIHRRFQAIVDANRDEIEARYPKVMRRCSGYNLDEFHRAERWNLSKLITGSEGTLATLLEAKLNLEPIPRHSAVCIVHFAELLEAVQAVEPIVGHGPSAVEILDASVLTRARANLSMAPLCEFLEGDPAAVLIVEFTASSDEEVRERTEGMIADMRAQGYGYAFPVRSDPDGKNRVWTVRKNGLGLMLGMKGDRKPLPFIEDAALPLEHLAEYIEKVLACCKRLDTEVAMYAHASVGLIHVRPILDLRRPDDIERMKSIAEEAFELVCEYRGSWCGEHGDGLVRSGFIERFFGPQLYRAFRDVKALFDPGNAMNPGKIIDPPPMDANLRFGSEYRTPDFVTQFQFVEDGGFAKSVEMCTGVGACRQTLSGTMCPSYRATRDEEHSTRGRANALRLAISGRYGGGGLMDDSLHGVMDLCFSCKACKSECPSNVDMARLKSEYLHMRRRERGTSLRDRLIAGTAKNSARSSGALAPLINGIQSTAAFRIALEKTAGFDRRRTLPRYARQSFDAWFSKRPPKPVANGREVVLFVDTFMNHCEPHIGQAAVELLEGCGYSVTAFSAGCCQRPRISHGFLDEARRDGSLTLRGLDRHLSRDVRVLVCEPSCASALTDDLPDLVEDGGLADRAKEGIQIIDVFLERERREGRIAPRLVSPHEKVLVHGHCHQKALYGTAAMMTLLGGVEGMEAKMIDSGCCGMAGSFGYETEHYDISLKAGEDRLFPALRACDSRTTIVASGFSCRHQIHDVLGTRARHWVETVRADNG